MNKKYLSVILFGALMLGSTGTFTSCKDYDDDINNLQEQIDKLATKEDMEAKLSQMQAAIDAAKATAEDALAKAEAAGNTEEIAKLEERIKALEDAAIDVEALKNEIKTAVDSQLSTFRTEIEELLKKMEEKLGLTVAEMVTSVELIVSQSAANAGDNTLSFGTVTEKDNIFGEGLEGAITFTKGTQVQIGDNFVVRVSPADAVLTPEMISLVNSKGENINDLVEITKVEPFNDLLVTRATTGSALWKVSCKLKAYDKDKFDAAKAIDDKDILYAVAVNNTQSTDETRSVVSSYDLQLAWASRGSDNVLNFTVDEKNIDNIRNRYTAAEDGTKAVWTEYVWSGAAATAINKDKTNVKVGDNRCDNAVDVKFNNLTATHKLLPVQQGVPFTIKVEQTDNNSIRAIYVVRDDANAVESAPSELNAWKSYTYVGLDKVVEGTETTVTINAEQAISDIIGFRVYAVNYDGTLVDPDGKAFYVVVGKTADITLVNLTVKPNEYAWSVANAPTSDSYAKYFDSDAQNFDTKNLKNVATFTVSQFAADGETSAPFDGEIYLKGKDVQDIRLQDAIFSSADLTKYTQIYYKNVDVRDIKDNETRIIEVVFKDKNGGIVETCDIHLTKVMPEFPTSIVPFTNVLVNNVLVVYPKHIEDGKAYYDLDNVWHGVDKHTTFAQTGVTADKATVVYRGTDIDPETSVDDKKPELGAPISILNPNAEENAAYKTEYPMINAYSFGYISYDKLEGATEYTNNEWIVKGQEFKVRFGNYVDDCTYAWKDNSAPTLAYPGVKEQTSFITLDNIVITDWYNRAAYLTPNTNILNGYASDVKVELLTGSDFSKVNEYYKAELKDKHQVGVDSKNNPIYAPVILLTSKVNASQGADVPTKIRLTITDIYGFKTVKVFDPFTMTFKK